MARSTLPPPGAGTALRDGVAGWLRHLASAFPTEGLRARLAAVEGGQEVLLDSQTLSVVLGRLESASARQFNYRADPENLRRFILTADDLLIETQSSEPDRPRGALTRGPVT